VLEARLAFDGGSSRRGWVVAWQVLNICLYVSIHKHRYILFNSIGRCARGARGVRGRRSLGGWVVAWQVLYIFLYIYIYIYICVCICIYVYMFYLFYFIEQCAEARVTLEGGAVYTGGWLRGRYCIYIYM